MFPHIQPMRPIPPLETLVARVRQVLLVKTPANTLIVEQIRESRHILRDPPKIVVVHAEVVSAKSGYVIRLAGVGNCVVVS
jgi:hypothetical protein